MCGYLNSERSLTEQSNNKELILTVTLPDTLASESDMNIIINNNLS